MAYLIPEQSDITSCADAGAEASVMIWTVDVEMDGTAPQL